MFSVYKLTKALRLVLPVRRGPKLYLLAVKITTVTFVVLFDFFYVRALKALEEVRADCESFN